MSEMSQEKLIQIAAAAEKLVRCKGRYHSEQNYRALAALFGVTTPDLPPLESDVMRQRAEPVYQLWSSGINQWIECDRARYDAHAHIPAQRRVLYTAPPAPVVTDAATAIRACLEEFPESVHDIVEECAAIAENACRAAMLAAPGAAVAVPDDVLTRLAWNIAVSFADEETKNDKELFHKLINHAVDDCRALMLTTPGKQPLPVEVLAGALRNAPLAPSDNQGRQRAPVNQTEPRFRIPEVWIFRCRFEKYPANRSWFMGQEEDGKSVTLVAGEVVSCYPPDFDIQFIDCDLPTSWKGKVSAIGCRFNQADPPPHVDIPEEKATDWREKPIPNGFSFYKVEKSKVKGLTAERECPKHPGTKLLVHPMLSTASMPSYPVYYCPECEPKVFEWSERNNPFKQGGDK